MIVTLKLNTDYKATGNESGNQIDTLAIAANCWTLNQSEEQNMEYFDERERHALKEYPHYERDFLATLSKAERKAYADDLDAFDIALSQYTTRSMETYTEDDSTPLSQHVYKERDWYYDNLRSEWLNGDHSNDGVLGIANKCYNVGFDYEWKTDTLTADVDDNEIADWIDNGHIERATKKAVTAYLIDCINDEAVARRTKSMADSEKRHAEYERTKAWQAEQAAKEAEALRARLLGNE